MRLLVEFAKAERAELRQNGIRVKRDRLARGLPTGPPCGRRPDGVHRRWRSHDAHARALLRWRQDIVEAARSLAVRARAGLVLPEEIDEASFHKHMTTHALPSVDLLIRTGARRA